MTFTSLILQKLMSYLRGDVDWMLGVIVAVLVIIRVVQFYLHERQLPPGPWGVPFLGYLPYVKTAPHTLFTKLSRKYGSTFSFRFGSHLIVVLSDYKTIRTAFRRECFSARPENEITQLIEGLGKKRYFFFIHFPPYCFRFFFWLTSFTKTIFSRNFRSICLLLKSCVRLDTLIDVRCQE